LSNRGIGVFFIAISTILYITKYLTAAIFGSNLKTLSEDMFKTLLEYIGPNLTFWSTISLVIGIVYLIWGQFQLVKTK